MSKMLVLFIDGIPDHAKVKMESIPKDGKIRWSSVGSANLYSHIKTEEFMQHSVVLDTKGEQELPKMIAHAIFNQISDPDSHKITLKKADDFYKAVSTNIPFFNPPSKIMQMTRDGVYKMLQGIEGLHVPKTVKIQPRTPQEIHDTVKNEAFTYPVIFRQAGDHGGISTVKVEDESQQFHAFALDGRDYYITQFIDYKEDGLYVKYRLVVVEGKVYLRHIKVSKEWMVHHKSQIKNPEAVQKKLSKKFLEETKEAIETMITQIYERTGLDYFGIDCHIDKNMNMLIFEVNPSMNVMIRVKGDVFEKRSDKIKEAIIKMIHSRIARNNLLNQNNRV